MNQDWFEMADIRRRNLSRSVWIPLRANIKLESHVQYGYEDYKEEYFGSGTLAVPIEKRKAAEKLDWMDVGISHHHAGRLNHDTYTPADLFQHHNDDLEGIHLVLDQCSYGDVSQVWHLHQDVILSLGLYREGDVWLCPEDGYIEVARIKKEEQGRPVLLEMRAQYLKDYLCARAMRLYITSYHSRDFITLNQPAITWKDGNEKDETGSDRWEGRVIPIHEGGQPYGEKVAVFHVARTDDVENDDVPDISAVPTEENTKHATSEHRFKGKKLYRIFGELWRNEWFEPGKLSPKLRGDKIQATSFFIIDAEGKKVSSDKLIGVGSWLWFKPDVIMALYHRRGGSLSFYTQDTGAVACSYADGVHFGVNELGYINVYAKDIGLLPDWQQQIWAGYNISPEAGVSAELLASQVKASPAETLAPEEFLHKGIQLVNKISQEKLGIKLLREHEIVPELVKKTHRFRALDGTTLYALAKDLARLTADSLDADAMQSIVPPPKKTKWGSLKSLENLLAEKNDREQVRKMTAPLVGVYELRHADAHLPGSKIEDAIKLLELDQSQSFVHQGFQLLDSCVTSIYEIADALKRWS
ncbi:hypothetical protein [Aliikangiella sp. IMCC44359]|uniref:hypothetical protein n=1 Tax=Aliikangiella sp. IMCC44359 TaxID=3459125 RepID=UPI00403AA223